MEKELIIPKRSDSVVNINEVGENYEGIIIVYSGQRSTGYIQYVDCLWNYYETINGGVSSIDANTLIELIQLISDSIDEPSFKVIEFYD